MAVYEYSARRDGTWIISKLGLVNVHPPYACENTQCIFHNPSDHPMLWWEPVFDASTGMVFRICGHGGAHPDPDSLAWLEKTRRRKVKHACDGCCTAG